MVAGRLVLVQSTAHPISTTIVTSSERSSSTHVHDEIFDLQLATIAKSFELELICYIYESNSIYFSAPVAQPVVPVGQIYVYSSSI